MVCIIFGILFMAGGIIGWIVMGFHDGWFNILPVVTGFFLIALDALTHMDE